MTLCNVNEQFGAINVNFYRSLTEKCWAVAQWYNSNGNTNKKSTRQVMLDVVLCCRACFYGMENLLWSDIRLQIDEKQTQSWNLIHEQKYFFKKDQLISSGGEKILKSTMNLIAMAVWFDQQRPFDQNHMTVKCCVNYVFRSKWTHSAY